MSSTSNQTGGFIPGSPQQNEPTPNQTHHQIQSQKNIHGDHGRSSSIPQIASSFQHSMDGSAFRALNPTVFLGLARSYAEALKDQAHNNISTSSNSPNHSPMSSRVSESDQEIIVHEDDSDAIFTHKLESTKNDRN